MQKLITRTFIGYEIEFETLDKATQRNVLRKEYVDERIEKNAIKYLTKKYDGNCIIKSVNPVRKLLAMDIYKFYNNAKPYERPLSQQR